MKIHEFNIEKGIYKFELDEMSTHRHAHPAFELIFSKSGGINLEVGNHQFQEVSMAIIAPNIPHKIAFQGDHILVLMMECNAEYFSSLLSIFNISLTEGYFIDKQVQNRQGLIDEIYFSLRNTDKAITSDERIQNCLTFLNSTRSDYSDLMTDLKQISHLSDSRLSHLFKQEVGISIKKYYVWSKLKRAFQEVIQEEKNMYEAALENGFYDQAHLSNAFKQLLGVPPSEVYNSRMIQVQSKR